MTAAARFASACLALLGAAACAAPQKQASVVVLLPSEGPSSGQVEVANQAGSQVLSRPWQATEVAGPGAAPTPPRYLDEASAQRIFGDALSLLPPGPARFLLYFEHDSPNLTAESEARLPELLATVRQRAPAYVSVVGHTDTVGAPDRNYRLGLQRAEATADRLRALGAAPAALEVASHGEAAPLVATDDEVPEPRNRRVEVTVR